MEHKIYQAEIFHFISGLTTVSEVSAMLQYLLMCRSLTYAQRASMLLERNGITAIVTKIPKNAAGSGCNYCIKVSESRLALALRILNNNNFGPIRVFLQAQDGSVSEVSV